MEEPQAGSCAKATTCAVLLSALHQGVLGVELEDEEEDEPSPDSSLSSSASAAAPSAKAPIAMAAPRRGAGTQ